MKAYVYLVTCFLVEASRSRAREPKEIGAKKSRKAKPQDQAERDQESL